ncbi:MAG: hypothetical protein GY845_30575 [Planctomycetes bacterium]|nr:hypothetical protein [Planctomycetota bacterium]
MVLRLVVGCDAIGKDRVDGDTTMGYEVLTPHTPLDYTKKSTVDSYEY